MHITDLGGKVGTALASIGSFVVAQVLSDTILNELVRLLSSSAIAIIGAIIGHYMTRLLKRIDRQRKERDQDPPDINPGAYPPAASEQSQ